MTPPINLKAIKSKDYQTVMWQPGIPMAQELFNSSSTISLFIWETRWGKGRFQIEVLNIVQNILENRIRHARRPVHFTWRLLHLYVTYRTLCFKTIQSSVMTSHHKCLAGVHFIKPKRRRFFIGKKTPKKLFWR